MMQKKVLKNIIHYNDCWFRNCFYQQLVAAYGAFGIPADYVVCNYTIDIDFSDDNETLDIREHEILDEDEFSALTGICQKEFVLKTSVNNYVLLFAPEIRLSWVQTAFIFPLELNTIIRSMLLIIYWFMNST